MFKVLCLFLVSSYLIKGDFSSSWSLSSIELVGKLINTGIFLNESISSKAQPSFLLDSVDDKHMMLTFENLVTAERQSAESDLEIGSDLENVDILELFFWGKVLRKHCNNFYSVLIQITITDERNRTRCRGARRIIHKSI